MSTDETDIGKVFLNKIMSKFSGKSKVIDDYDIIVDGKRYGHSQPQNKSLSPEEQEAETLKRKVAAQETILANKLKLKALQSVTQEQLDRAFEEFDMQSFIQTLFQTKIADYFKSKAYTIVSEALEDFDEDSRVLRPIRDYAINKIKDSFK